MKLNELEDWNCCGSSSAQTMCKNLCLAMAARNLSLAPPGRPLVAMCPRCLHYPVVDQLANGLDLLA